MEDFGSLECFKDFDVYSHLSTRKRIDGMSDGAKVFISRYLKEFVLKYEVNKINIIRYLTDKNLAHSTKAVAAIGLGRYFLWLGRITKEDYNGILSAFRMPQKDWSSVGLTEDNVYKAIKEAGVSGGAYARRRNQLMIFLLASIGMRVSQLVEMMSSDVIIEDKFVRYIIPRKKDVRNSIRNNLDVKFLPLKYSVKDLIHKELYDKYMEVKPESTYFFVNKQNNILTTRYVQMLTDKIGKSIGVDLNPHKFRHYVGTTIANKQGGLVKAKILLGHSDIRTTLKYVYPENINIWEEQQ